MPHTIKKETTLKRYEALCREWESRGLQGMPVSRACKHLNVSAMTLRTALNVCRPGAYRPNDFKHHAHSVFVYEPCTICGKDTFLKLKLDIVDKYNRIKLVSKSVWICKDCLEKFKDVFSG